MSLMSSTILFVDDDPEPAVALRGLLDREIFEVIRVDGGPEGEKAAAEMSPRAIVLSADVPNGFSHCRHFKKDPGLATIPLVLVSATVDPDTFDKHSRLPTRADAYLMKPFQGEQLREVLSSFVDFANGGSGEVTTTLAEPPSVPSSDGDRAALDDAIRALRSSERRVDELGGRLQREKNARETAEALASQYLDALTSQASALKKAEARAAEASSSLNAAREAEATVSDRLAKTSQDASTTTRTLENELETLRADCTVLQIRASEEEGKNSALGASFASLQASSNAERAELNEKRSALITAQEAAEQVLLATRETHQSELSTLKAALDSTVLDRDSEGRARRELEEHLADLSSELKTAQAAQVDALKAQESLRTEIGAVQSQIESAREAQESTLADKQALHLEVEGLCKQLETLQEVHDSAVKTRIEATSALENAREQNATLATAVSEVREEVSGLARSLQETQQEADAQREHLSGRIIELEAADEAHRAQAGVSSERIAELDAQLTATQERESALEESLGQERERAEKATLDQETATKERDSAVLAENAANEEAMQLRKQFNETTAANEALQEIVAELQAERDTLSENLADTTESNEKLDAELETTRAHALSLGKLAETQSLRIDRAAEGLAQVAAALLPIGDEALAQTDEYASDDHEEFSAEDAEALAAAGEDREPAEMEEASEDSEASDEDDE